MKNIALFIIVVLMSTAYIANGQTAADKLYKEAVQFDNTFKLYVQKPLVKAGIKALKDEVGKGNLDEQLWKLASYTKRMKILVMEVPETGLIKTDKTTFLSDLKEDNFEDYVKIRHKKSTVNVMVREKKEKIRNILFLIMDNEEGLVMVDIKTKIPLEVLNSLDISSKVNDIN